MLKCNNLWSQESAPTFQETNGTETSKMGHLYFELENGPLEANQRKSPLFFRIPNS